MPAGLDQYLSGSRNKASPKVVDIPIPNPIADKFAVRVLSRTNRVVNKPQLCAETSNTSTHACSVILRSICQRPSSGRLVVRCWLNTKCQRMLANQVTNPPAPLLG